MEVKVENGKLGVLYTIKDKLSNGQTMLMDFYNYRTEKGNRYWNVSASIYTKRKNIEKDEELKHITGNSPFESAIVGMKAFKMLEQAIVNDYNHWNNIIEVHGTNKKRTEAYYAFLSKRGYKYKTIYGKQFIVKTFLKNT